MANTSILAAFERMWQYAISALEAVATNKLDKSEGITGLSASGKTITYTKGNGTTGTITTQDTTYSNATTSVAGLMSASDKSKLDGFVTINNLKDGEATGSLRSVGAGKESSSYKLGGNSTAFGYSTTASGYASHAEGSVTTASGDSSHAEAFRTTASGNYSHAEGKDTTASGECSHAEGYETTAFGERSHAEGYRTIASGKHSHVEGYGTFTTITLTGEAGSKDYQVGTWNSNIKVGAMIVYQNSVAKIVSINETNNSITLDKTLSVALSKVSVKLYYNGGVASGMYSHAEGLYTTASGHSSHAEGEGTTASGSNSHAEGEGTTASGSNSHAEGNHTTASGSNSHAEGNHTTASGSNSHAEGYDTTASGDSSHAEGLHTTASGYNSHAEGEGTIARGSHQHVQGKFNIEDSSNKYAHIVGNGESDTARSNAHTLDWDGNGWFARKIKVGGTGYYDASAVEVVLKSDLANIDGAVIVDDILSSTSTNPVQNKVINAAISNLNTLVGGKAVSEQIEDAIANSSGASVPSDWNANDGEAGHVLNRPFYSENRPVALLPTTSLTANGSFGGVDGIGFLPALLDVGGGMEYVVTYNGVDYTCAARFTSFDGIPCFILGNSYAFGDENTGEPFLVCAFPEAIAAEVGVYGGVIPLDGSGTFSISISQITEVVHKLPSKFMPEGVPFIGEGQTVIFPPTTLVVGNNGACDIPLSDFNHDFIVGETYTVTVEGLAFNCVAQAVDGEDVSFIAALGNITGDTGEPFVIAQYTDETAEIMGIKMRIVFPGLVDSGESASATLSIIWNKVVHKLANECLPDDVLTRKNLVKNVRELSDDEKASIRNEISPFTNGVIGSFTLNVDGWEEYNSMGYLYKLPSYEIFNRSVLVIAFPADLDSRFEFYTRNCRYFCGNVITHGVICDSKPTKAFSVRFVLGSPYEDIVV